MKPNQLLVLYLALAMGTAQSGQRNDCQQGNVDSTCIDSVSRQNIPKPPTPLPLYSGPIAGATTAGAAYWGFDFEAETEGIPSPVPRDMFINRSSSAISLLFTFDLPPRPCGSGCLPGVEFKLDAKWGSFFPNIVVAGNQAVTSTVIAPGQAYGWVIALWGASNPQVTVQTLGPGNISLHDVGLQDLSIASAIPGQYFQCTCGDGVTKTCYSGTRYSNGLMGSWYRDRYSSWDAVGC